MGWYTILTPISNACMYDADFIVMKVSTSIRIAQDGTCTGVEIGRVANFTASVTLQECTPELAAGPRRWV